MTRRGRSLDGREIVHALERGGFVVVRVKGSHHMLRHHADATRFTVVPVHAGETIKPGTLRSILKQARLSWTEFAALL